MPTSRLAVLGYSKRRQECCRLENALLTSSVGRVFFFCACFCISYVCVLSMQRSNMGFLNGEPTTSNNQYETLMRRVYEHGAHKSDHTRTDTRSIFSYQMHFDLSEKSSDHSVELLLHALVLGEIQQRKIYKMLLSLVNQKILSFLSS